MSLKVRVWTSKILKYDDAIIMINFVRLSSATKKTGHRIKRVRERQREPKFLRRFHILALEPVMYIMYALPLFEFSLTLS